MRICNNRPRREEDKTNKCDINLAEGLSQMIIDEGWCDDYSTPSTENEHTVVFWNARHTGADENGGVYYYDADYMFFL